MALDSRIALAGQGVDLIGSVTGGLQVGENIRNMGVRDNILRQNEQITSLQVKQTQEERALQGMQTLGKTMDAIADIPDLATRVKVWAQQSEMLKELGVPESSLRQIDLSNEGLRIANAQFKPFLAQKEKDATAAQNNFEYFTNIYEDESATEAQRQSAGVQLGLEARQGRLSTKDFGNGIFGTFNSNTGEVSNPYFIDPETSERRPLSRDQQAELRNNESVDRILAEGEASTDVAISQQEQLDVLEMTQAERLTEQSNRQARATEMRNQYGDIARDAARSQVTLNEALTLAQNADQGFQAGAKLFFAKVLPGVDVSDEAALDSALKTLALEQLSKFKGPTTDFEFQVTQDISGEILGSASANKARIASLDRANWFRAREAQQFDQWASSGRDPNAFRFNYFEEIETKRGTFSLTRIQDTAVQNAMTMDQVIELLNGAK